jgi:DNA invertase Pin-like site-specific DNA recombinase
MTTIAMLRVSDKNKQDNESQRLRIIEYAKANDITIDKWYEDSGSGAKPWSETMWAELLPEYKNATVLVTDFSRFSRDGGRTFQLKALCEERNIQLYDIQMQCNPFEDTTVLYIQSMLSELELEKIKMRSKAGHNNRAKRGKGTGYGFKEDGSIYLPEYNILMMIICARLVKKSFAQIAESMNKVKLRTRDGKKWTKMWVYKLFNSPKVQNIINYQMDDFTRKSWIKYDNHLYETLKPEYDAAMKMVMKPITEDTGFKLLSPCGTDYDTFNDQEYDDVVGFIVHKQQGYWGEME